MSLLATTLHAEERRPDGSAARERAATLYDRGVVEFERAEYARAAQSFLDADTAAPSNDAVRNALAAARRANDDALVRVAAQRALTREGSDPELSRQAKAALAALPAPPPEPPAANPSAGSASTNAASTPAAMTTDGSATAVAPPARAPDQPLPGEKAWARPVFFAGAVATGALVGVTIWSGIDALHARNELPGTQAENDAVTARAHRTDALLASSVLVGAATAYVGLVWVDWSKHPSVPRASASVDRRGAYVSVSGAF
jgi:hypothetical protein